MNPVIEVSGLSCRFGKVEAVRDLTLAVPEGSIYAFLGTNGAGKTTTIKALLGLVTPRSGTLKLLGTSPEKLGPAELAQIGYVSENQKLPEMLTVKQLIAYSKALYPTWDDAFCALLVEKLALPLDRKVKDFSRGMKMKAALLVSLAYRPRLLLLDEPFAGLDPLVREEFIDALLELSRQHNWTMFISSHDIDEVERLADWIGIIDAGRLCLSESLKTLRTRFRRVEVTLSEGIASAGFIPPEGLLPEVSGATAKWIDSRYADEAAVQAQVADRFPTGAAVATAPLNLREVFIAVTRLLRQNPNLKLGPL
jgi:ABC-2 type transport system ATP-binding protein